MGQEGTISDIDGVSSHWVHFSGCHEVLEKQPVFHASIIRRLLFFEDRILCHQIISLAVLLTSGTVCSRSTIHTVSQTLYRAIDFNRSARHPLAITSHHARVQHPLSWYHTNGAISFTIRQAKWLLHRRKFDDSYAILLIYSTQDLVRCSSILRIRMLYRRLDRLASKLSTGSRSSLRTVFVLLYSISRRQIRCSARFLRKPPVSFLATCTVRSVRPKVSPSKA